MFSSPLWEARIADLKEAHAAEVSALNKVIAALADEIEYMRATRPFAPQREATPGLAWQGILGEDDPLPAPTRMHITEEEEDLLALREADLISDAELEGALAKLQLS